MSQNPYERLKSHNKGKVGSTKSRRPYTLKLIEEFDGISETRNREKYYKTGFGKKVWKKNNKGLRIRGSQLAPNQREGWRGSPEGSPICATLRLASQSK